jgi:hypothetical protein
MSKLNLTTYDDATLNTMAEEIAAEMERRRERFDISDIRPGMTAEERAKARAEIARVMRDGN